jgi:hypothetical protein
MRWAPGAPMRWEIVSAQPALPPAPRPSARRPFNRGPGASAASPPILILYLSFARVCAGYCNCLKPP